MRITFAAFMALLSLFAATCQAQTVTTIPLVTNHIVYDHVSGNIYATVPSSNSIVAINPATGTTGTPIPIGNTPDALAVSDDGQYLYVGLDGVGAIQRYDIPSALLGIQFSIGTPGNGVAEDLLVPSGQPHTVIAISGNSYQPSSGGTSVYDDGVAR